jgi:hypothetical protein
VAEKDVISTSEFIQMSHDCPTTTWDTQLTIVVEVTAIFTPCPADFAQNLLPVPEWSVTAANKDVMPICNARS